MVCLQQEREREKFREIAEWNSTEFQPIIMNKCQKGSPLVPARHDRPPPLSSAIRRAREQVYVAGDPGTNPEQKTQVVKRPRSKYTPHPIFGTKSCNVRAARKRGGRDRREEECPIATNW
jgi:hypothetical protein